MLRIVQYLYCAAQIVAQKCAIDCSLILALVCAAFQLWELHNLLCNLLCRFFGCSSQAQVHLTMDGNRAKWGTPIRQRASFRAYLPIIEVHGVIELPHFLSLWLLRMYAVISSIPHYPPSHKFWGIPLKLHTSLSKENMAKWGTPFYGRTSLSKRIHQNEVHPSGAVPHIELIY